MRFEATDHNTSENIGFLHVTYKDHIELHFYFSFNPTQMNISGYHLLTLSNNDGFHIGDAMRKIIKLLLALIFLTSFAFLCSLLPPTHNTQSGHKLERN